MHFDAAAFGPNVAELLALDGDGQRLMPLAGGACSSQPARNRLLAAEVDLLFPEARAPQAALAGLFVYFSCWTEAHETAQNTSSREGSYWHAIVHRQEPDAGNAGYWFRQVGRHPIFPKLRAIAGDRLRMGADWDPLAFIEFCESARQSPGSGSENIALEIQRAEWQLLFSWCAGKES